MPKLAND